MPKIDTTKEAEVKREIRVALAINPMISSRRLQQELAKKGITSAGGGLLDHEYILKLIRKINGEARQDIQNSEIEGRMVETRERFKASFERLFKIAFWQWDYMNEGIFMPETKDVIKALEVIMKMDIALIEAEMDAGIYKRNLGTLEIEKRNTPLTEDRKHAIMMAMKNWGLLPETTIQNATEQPTTEPAAAQRSS